ncbi:MAG: V-type ATPase 116kDa subunit family protein [Gammaproteobacteria bacterium]|nr:V-type ATPase 116kDa subunit family protein [Gammaproteobacteria bacterium]
MLRIPLPMQRMQLRLLSDDAQAAANTLAGMSVVHLQVMDKDELAEYPAAEFAQIYDRIKSRYRKILGLAGLPMMTASTNLEQKMDITLDQLTGIDDQLRQLWGQMSSLEEEQRRLKEKSQAVKQLRASLQRFLSLDIQLSRLGRKSQFLNVIAGTIASKNRNHLQQALSIVGYALTQFYSGEGSDYVLIVGSSEQEEEVQGLLKSADFRELSLPEEFKDEPQLIEQQLQQQMQDVEASLVDNSEQIDNLVQQHSELITMVHRLLPRASAYASLSTYLKGRGRLVSLQGWVPESETARIQQALDETLDYPYQVSFATPTTDELEQVPTKLKQSWWITPFQSLIGQYGLPQYCEFDPGMLFALSYTLMFGMMFGDVGHGAVIITLAFLLRNKLKPILVVGSLAGLSSIIFGFLYGSIFGYEHILHPLWMSPMHDPGHILTLALYWGIGFLILANLLSIRNLWVRNQRQQALYGAHGLVGLLFYVTAVLSLILMFEFEREIAAWQYLIMLVLMATILFQGWQHASGTFVERIVIVLIEGLEYLISNMSATLSFLRVAAFSLNHVALAAAVFAIAAMLDTFGHWVTILLGNVFIIVLEGAIVAIQCLRLEFYEGFSRFFSGKGQRFRPLQTEVY